ncbi:MAG: hypothetical protein HY286_01275 [Planctomycetes bacterium]|nr:hypothetical protein [Planctomycetota bacterium]
MKRPLLIATASLLLAAIGVGNAAPPTPQPALTITEADAAKQFGAAIKTAGATLKSSLKTLKSSFNSNAVGIYSSLKFGAINADAAMQSLYDLANDYMEDIQEAGQTAADAVADAGSAILAQIANNKTPHDLASGGCGALDKFVNDTNTAVAKDAGAAMANLKKMNKDYLQKLGHLLTAQVLDSLGLGAFAGVFCVPKAAGKVPAKKKFKMDATGGGSDSTVDNDGRICMGGTADPAKGAITVTITGPFGGVLTQQVNVDNKCRWRACFPISGSNPTLPEGNYDIDAGQGTTHKTGAISIP